MKTFYKELFKKLNWPYAVFKELKILRAERISLWTEAIAKFEEEECPQFSLHDYKRAERRHRVSFQEYCAFELWRMTKREQRNYLSESELKSIYRKTVDFQVARQLDNKLLIHIEFEKYMRRAWLCPCLSDYETFRQFLVTHDCIIKPWYGSLGNGVFLVKQNEVVDLPKLYDNCVQNHLIVEERVRACKEIEEFHPQSLNTIRVFTISNGTRTEIVAAEIRIGVGDNIIDNAAAGGIVASIDTASGVITNHGRAYNGKTYISHPDTGKVFKGFVIPHWDKVREACKEMSVLVPEAKFAGWDLCVLENGEIEMIEVNSSPNIMGLQVAYGEGLRPKIQALGKELLGRDLMKQMLFYAKPMVNYSQKKRSLQSWNVNRCLDDYVMMREQIIPSPPI